MNEHKINTNFNINIQKIGSTPNNRTLYSVSSPNGNEHINVSVRTDQKDSFEKSISTINRFGKNLNNQKEQKNNKIKAYTALIGLGSAGIAIPAYITRNSKPLIKILSIIGGAALGVIGGFIGFITCLVPKGYKEAQIAQQILQTIDIKVENQLK